MAVTFYSEADLDGSAYARVLVCGVRKGGKTTAVLTSAPTPIAVLNADGSGAPFAARRHGATGLKILDVDSVDLWMGGCIAAKKMADQGEVKSIVVDTVSLLINVVIADEMSKRFKGYDVWSNTYQAFLDGFKILKKAPAHLFMTVHYSLDDGQLVLDGKLKEVIPGLVHDIVCLDYKAGRTVKGPDGGVVKMERGFVIGPSTNGLSGGRQSDENKLIPANVKVLLEELGIAE